MQEHNWVDSVPFSITVCDRNGVITDMNDKSAQTFAKDGGKELIGKSLFDCHSPRDNRKIEDLISSAAVNVYTIEKEGKKKLIYQCPWYQNGEVAGLVEISLPLPEAYPHFIRDRRIIYHVTHADHWQRAKKIGHYLPETFDTDGFIHCSKKEQIPDVGNRYYKGQVGHIVLSINLEKLSPKLVWENTSGGEELFPHLYGPLNLDAVEFFSNFEPNEDGEFEFPDNWVKI